MASTSLSKSEFEREIGGLLRLKHHVAATLRPAVEAILKFAAAYRTVHQRIGPDYDRRVALRARLGLDEYQHQRLMAIAERSKTLSEFTRVLPPAVEPLYELARLARDAAGEKRLRTAVQRHELTPTSGVREIRSIRHSTRRPSKQAVATPKAEPRRPPALEFVIEADEGIQWDTVTQFKTELANLLAKHNLRFAAGGGFKNENAVRQFYAHQSARRESEQSQCSAETDSANPMAEAEALHAKYQTLETQWWEQVRRRAERGIRKLIHAKYEPRVRAEYPALSATRFPHFGARRRAAEKRTGLYGEDVRGGVLTLAEVMTIKTDEDVNRCIQTAENARAEGADLSLLVQAQNVGVGEGSILDAIRDAERSVPESARLRKAREACDRAASALESSEPSDDALKEFSSRFNRNRRRLNTRTEAGTANAPIPATDDEAEREPQG